MTHKDFQLKNVIEYFGVHRHILVTIKTKFVKQIGCQR